MSPHNDNPPTYSTEGMVAAAQAARLELLIRTQRQIIAALRNQLAAQEELLHMYQGDFGNGEGLGEPY